MLFLKYAFGILTVEPDFSKYVQANLDLNFEILIWRIFNDLWYHFFVLLKINISL